MTIKPNKEQIAGLKKVHNPLIIGHFSYGLKAGMPKNVLLTLYWVHHHHDFQPRFYNLL